MVKEINDRGVIYAANVHQIEYKSGRVDEFGGKDICFAEPGSIKIYPLRMDGWYLNVPVFI